LEGRTIYKFFKFNKDFKENFLTLGSIIFLFYFTRHLIVKSKIPPDIRYPAFIFIIHCIPFLPRIVTNRCCYILRGNQNKAVHSKFKVNIWQFRVK
jgi:hypothetical protein